MIHKTVIIGKNVHIGKNVEIGPYVVIGDNTFIGDNTKIYSHAIIGSFPEHLMLDESEYSNDKFTTTIGSDCVIREFVTINCGMPGKKTIVSKNCYLMTKSHIGHDAELCNNCVICTGAKIGGHSRIGSFCYVGLNATTHQRALLNCYSIVGAQSFYKGKEKPRGLVWAGVPAKPIKVNTFNIEKNVLNEKNKKEIMNSATRYLQGEI